jgi:hypothetical protein
MKLTGDPMNKLSLITIFFLPFYTTSYGMIAKKIYIPQSKYRKTIDRSTTKLHCPSKNTKHFDTTKFKKSSYSTNQPRFKPSKINVANITAGMNFVGTACCAYATAKGFGNGLIILPALQGILWTTNGLRADEHNFIKRIKTENDFFNEELSKLNNIQLAQYAKKKVKTHSEVSEICKKNEPLECANFYAALFCGIVAGIPANLDALQIQHSCVEIFLPFFAAEVLNMFNAITVLIRRDTCKELLKSIDKQMQTIKAHKPADEIIQSKLEQELK